MGKAFKILPYNYLADWGEFESFNGTFPEGWLASTAGTYASDTTNKKYGNYGLSIVGSCIAGIYRTIPNGSDYYGKTFKLSFWAKSTSTMPYIQLSDGVTESTCRISTANTWQELTIIKKLDYAATQIRIDLLAGIGSTVYFDSGYLVEGADGFLNLDTNYDVSSWQPQLNLKQDQYEIANREGSFIPEYHLQSRNIKVTGNVVGTDVASCRSNFDTLMKSLLSWQKNEKRNVYLYDDRVLEVYLKSFNWNYVNGLQMIKFDLQFSAPDSTTRYINKFRKRQVIAGTVTEFNLSYNGNAESKPVVRFLADQAAAITTCSLENLTTGENLAYTGTVPQNAALEIDCLEATVKNSSIDKISDFTGDFLGLVRGTNYFRFAGSNCTIMIDYFERWY